MPLESTNVNFSMSITIAGGRTVFARSTSSDRSPPSVARSSSPRSSTTTVPSLRVYWVTTASATVPPRFGDGLSYGGGRGGPSIDGLLVEPTGPVRGTHQRPAHHAGETDRLGLFAERHELLRPHPTLYRVVAGARPQVLRDREQFAAGIVQIPQRLGDLVALLAK